MFLIGVFGGDRRGRRTNPPRVRDAGRIMADLGFPLTGLLFRGGGRRAGGALDRALLGGGVASRLQRRLLAVVAVFSGLRCVVALPGGYGRFPGVLPGAAGQADAGFRSCNVLCNEQCNKMCNFFVVRS